MPIALRALVMLAVVMPLFAAKVLQPLWWQILIAAAIGSALGQLAVQATRGRRVAASAVAGVAALIAALPVAWMYSPGTRDDEASARRCIVVRSEIGGMLTWDDVHAIETQIPSVQLAVPYLRKSLQVMSAEQNWNTDVVGTTPDYVRLRAWTLAAGHAFAASESAKVVVLGETVVKQLFGASASPIGETVRIQNVPYEVIGVLAHEGKTREGQDLDDVALLPIDVYASHIAYDLKQFGGQVLISPATPGETANVKAALRELLRERHRLAPGTDDDFVIHDSLPLH